MQKEPDFLSGNQPSISTPGPGNETVNPGAYLRTGLHEGEMKRKRRVSIEFERREVTVTVRHSADVAVSPEGKEHASGSAPANCFICGCSQLLPIGDSMARYSGSQVDLSRALSTGELHLAVTGNELWLCERSFDAFKETRR